MNENAPPKGVLHLIPTPLGENLPLEVLPLSVKKTVEDLDHFIVENEKIARRFIKKITPQKNQVDLSLFPLNKYTTQNEIDTYLNPCVQGISMGLLSDAGCPGIADPGAVIVAKAHANRIKVIPHIGPSSIILSLMSSGLNGQNFAFNGYLPIDKKQRAQSIQRLEKKALLDQQAQLFIETPYRSDALFQELVQTLSPSTFLCVACDLNQPNEFILTQTAQHWKKNNVNFNKRPCIFILDAGF